MVPDKQDIEKEKDFEIEAGMREVKYGKIPVWVWVVIALVIVAGTFVAVMTARRVTTCPWEMKAVFALRALGNVELAYRDFNIENRYATLDALKANGFIKENYPEKRIVPNYRIETTSMTAKNGTTYFVIRIFPLTGTRPCGTFQIGPERTIMEFKPRISYDPHRRENWVEAYELERTLPERERLPWMGENYPYN